MKFKLFVIFPYNHNEGKVKLKFNILYNVPLLAEMLHIYIEASGTSNIKIDHFSDIQYNIPVLTINNNIFLNTWDNIIILLYQTNYSPEL